MQYALTPNPAPRPQHSLTMQHALSDSPAYLELEPPPLPQRHSDEGPSRHRPSAESSSARISKPHLDTGGLTPPRPQRQRASSEPPPDSPVTPSARRRKLASGDQVQCSGRTQKGTRCTRMVKSGPALDLAHPDAQCERYCHQHMERILSAQGFYSHATKEWVNFDGECSFNTTADNSTEISVGRMDPCVPGRGNASCSPYRNGETSFIRRQTWIHLYVRDTRFVSKTNISLFGLTREQTQIHLSYISRRAARTHSINVSTSGRNSAAQRQRISFSAAGGPE